MKNTLEIQFRALRAPRVLKKSESGEPEFVDIWAIHHVAGSSHAFSLAVKCGKEIIDEAQEIKVGTLFTVKGRLDQTKGHGTGFYHTFIRADEIVDLVHSKKPHPPKEAQPDLPQPESPHA